MRTLCEVDLDDNEYCEDGFDDVEYRENDLDDDEYCEDYLEVMVFGVSFTECQTGLSSLMHTMLSITMLAHIAVFMNFFLIAYNIHILVSYLL